MLCAHSRPAAAWQTEPFACDGDESDFRQGLLAFVSSSRQQLQRIQGIGDFDRCCTPLPPLEYSDPVGQTDLQPLESPWVPDMGLVFHEDEYYKPFVEISEVSRPSDVRYTDPPDDDIRPAKRSRPGSSRLGYYSTLPADVDATLSSTQQQVEFLRQENDALQEQQLQSMKLTNRVVMENQLLRGILWAYVQLRRGPSPSPSTSGNK